MSTIGKVTALNVFLYSMMGFAAHITLFSHMFEKKVQEITRKFLWGKDSSSVAYEIITLKPQADGLGLIDAGKHCRTIWSKLALQMLTTHRRSPHAA